MTDAQAGAAPTLHDPGIAVVGLGYVGLPLAVAFARHYPVCGFDVDEARVAELRAGADRTGEVAPAELAATAARFTGRPADIAGNGLFIITVPTPVDVHNVPDLGAVRDACRIVGGALGRGAVVVLESTVYPGVTEEICGPELAAASGLVCGRDFFLGYSPERINPGDPEHRIERIVKVVAGQDDRTARALAETYGRICAGGVFVARDIRTAEAAKVIENAQRDINIAFMNEAAAVFHKMGLSIHDVLDAARTKWNFLGFSPGLVGGHCIGVDPFYLAHAAAAAGHHPEIVLAGRRINDSMGVYVADRIARELARSGRGAGACILVLGLTFKENVPDLRNSRVVDLVAELRARGFAVDLHDAHADPGETEALFGTRPLAGLDGAGGYDCAIGAVAHDAYRRLAPEALAGLLRGGGLLADVKGIWRGAALPDGYRRWLL